MALRDTCKQLLITNRVALQSVRHHVIDILDKDDIRILLVEVLNERTMSTRAEQQFTIRCAEWCTIRISRQRVGRRFLLGIRHMELHT